MTTRFWTAMVSLGLLCGCGDVPTAAPEAVEEHVSERTESRPHEPDGHELKAGAVDCSARTDTGYVSGSPFAISTVVVDGKPVEIDTANAYTVMQREAAADGIFLQVISGFRTQAEQQYLYGCYVNCNCNNCNLAAFPGYSNHQSGYALDLNTAAPGVYRWLERNAARFGFKRTVPSEDWHWEYFGGAPAGGVCSGAPLAPEPEPEPQGVALDFENLEDGGWYRNGIWFKVQTDAPEVHHVRYLADGYPMGVSEHRDDGFSLRYTFHSLGDREIQAEAFDAENRPIGQTTLKIRVTDGDLPTESVSFATLEDGGWYRNGQWLKAEASDGVARVAYFAGKYQLGQSSDGPERFAHRVSFGTLGYRALLAVGYDAQDREVARATVLARFLPGDDPQPQVAFLTLTQGRQVPNGVLIKSMASDTVARVDYSAGGYLMGSSTDVSGHFPLDYTFSQTGQRTVKAEAFDTQGRSVAQTQVDITVSP